MVNCKGNLNKGGGGGWVGYPAVGQPSHPGVGAILFFLLHISVGLSRDYWRLAWTNDSFVSNFTLVLSQNAKSLQICCGFQGGPFLISCSGATRCLHPRENACCAGIRLTKPSVHMCVLPMLSLYIVCTGKMARWNRKLTLLSLYTFLTLVVTSCLGVILVALDFRCKGS